MSKLSDGFKSGSPAASDQESGHGSGVSTPASVAHSSSSRDTNSPGADSSGHDFRPSEISAPASSVESSARFHDQCNPLLVDDQGLREQGVSQDTKRKGLGQRGGPSSWTSAKSDSSRVASAIALTKIPFEVDIYKSPIFDEMKSVWKIEDGKPIFTFWKQLEYVSSQLKKDKSMLVLQLKNIVSTDSDQKSRSNAWYQVNILRHEIEAITSALSALDVIGGWAKAVRGRRPGSPVQKRVKCEIGVLGEGEARVRLYEMRRRVKESQQRIEELGCAAPCQPLSGSRSEGADESRPQRNRKNIILAFAFGAPFAALYFVYTKVKEALLMPDKPVTQASNHKVSQAQQGPATSVGGQHRLVGNGSSRSDVEERVGTSEKEQEARQQGSSYTM